MGGGPPASGPGRQGSGLQPLHRGIARPRWLYGHGNVGGDEVTVARASVPFVGQVRPAGLARPVVLFGEGAGGRSTTSKGPQQTLERYRSTRADLDTRVNCR